MSIELMLEETRSRRAAMWRGARGQCPACGTKSLFAKYLKVRDLCPSCGLHLGGHQADDAPPYFTIFIVGHIIVPIALIVERAYMPPLYVHFLIFSVLSVVVAMASLPIVKGAVVGLQWALRMHGFADSEAITKANSNVEPSAIDVKGDENHD